MDAGDHRRARVATGGYQGCGVEPEPSFLGEPTMAGEATTSEQRLDLLQVKRRMDGARNVVGSVIGNGCGDAAGGDCGEQKKCGGSTHHGSGT